MPSPTYNRADRRRVKDSLESSLEGGATPDTFSFPNNLAEIEHWIAFRIQKGKLFQRDDFQKMKDDARVFLPIPANLGTQYGHDYNTTALGAAGKFGAGEAGASGRDVIQSIKDKVQDYETLKNDISEAAIYYALESPEAIGAAIGSKIGGASGAIGGALAGQALKGSIAGAGLARNPYMAVMYSAPQFRSHQFSWKLIPRSIDETETIRNIIRTFKYYAAPGLNEKNKHFFDYPHQFDVEFHYDDYLFNIAPSVLTSLEVNYHAEGQPLYHDTIDESFFADEVVTKDTKSPVSISINMTLQEISIVTKDTIDEQNR